MNVDFALAVMSGEARGTIASCLRAALAVLAGGYGLGLAAYMWPYKTGLRRRKRLSRPVISVGNLTFGGSGKTPVVRMIAAGMLQRGLRPAILSRGHGGSSKGGALVVSNGSRRLVDAEQCGDEPAMLADLLAGVPVVVGKNRYETGLCAIEEFDPGVILLDDGMQYWQLHRDVDVVLINAVDPFGFGRLMPRGCLREPVTGLSRAEAVIVTNSDRLPPEELARLLQTVRALSPKAALHTAVHRPVSLRDLAGGTHPVEWLQDRRVVALSSIGAPHLFGHSIRDLGAKVISEHAYPDHHLWQREEVRAICEAAGARGAEVLITTEKDAVKLPDGETSLPVIAVDITVELDSASFVQWLLERAGLDGTKQ